jgi:NAD(P)-dependent dehydrogenase (short-subunit alcohol dehydrogenase family)
MKIIITGAASGIGRATAQKLAADVLGRGGRPQLLLADIAREPLEQAAERARALGAQVETHVGDLADPSVCLSIVQHAEAAFGGLDILVSNAGILNRASLLDLTLEDYDRTFAVNTRATWLLARAAFPMLRQSKGCIVATCSIAAYEPTPALGAYAPSKAALLMLVRQLANDWGPHGIRCNSVSPGSTVTSIGQAPGTVKPSADRPGANPLGLKAAPEDQAAAIAFLAGPDARFVNGADLVVDGGARTQLMTVSGMARPDN